MNKFVLVINSTDYFQRFTNVNDQTYIMNNTNIPNGNYRCRWSYRSSSEATGALTAFPTIYLRTTTTQQAYSVNSTGGNQISYCLGSARQFVNTGLATSYYFSGPQDNVCFYWNYIPGSEIRITLRSAFSQNLYTGTSDYLFMIEMERIDDDGYGSD